MVAANAAQKAAMTHRNEVFLTGRLSTPAASRILPNGDEVVSWRLVVDRPTSATRSGIDAVDCVASTARLRQAALHWQPGEIIEIEGALRRRFWRRGLETASRFEVEVTRARRLG